MSDENDQLKQLLPFDDVREILGRICIHCGAIANVLRLDGKEIPCKAEEEQAAVIYYLLGLYVKHGKEWSECGDKELKTILEKARSEGRIK